MKIIQDNRPETRFTYPFRVSCLRCKSVLEAEEGDVRSGTTGQPQQDNGRGFFYVVCGVCQNWVAVKPGPAK